MQETSNTEEIPIPKIDMKDVQLKEYNGQGIRIYIWGDIVRCDMNGKRYYTKLMRLRWLVFGKSKFCYFSDKYPTDEEIKAYNEKKEAEFQERFKRSLRG